MSDNRIEEQQKDIEELKTLITQSQRQNVKQYLNSYLNKLETDLEKLQKAATTAQVSNQQTTSTTKLLTGYNKIIDSYGWDQSEKFLKIYITSLKDLNKVNSNDVICNFKDRSFDLLIKNLNNVNYSLTINNLLNDIDPKESSVKVKTDMITIMLRKKKTESWSCVTEKEFKIKDKNKPKFNDTADPQDSLMTMMKQMYDEGDDEMKRTISKAFVESREKQMNGEI